MTDQDTAPDDPTPTEVAEASLLGAMLLSDQARTGALGQVHPDSFVREAHRTLFVSISELVAAGTPVDPVTVNDRLWSTGRLDEVGGATTVHALTAPESCPVVAHWPAYVEVVNREARRRRGIAVLSRAIRRLEAGEDPSTVATELGIAS